MKKIFALALSVICFAGAKAQSESYPLYFGQYGLNGTASYIGKAGAIGALGGDIMSAQYNPAGLGIYTSSEITFSSGVDITSVSANYNGMKFNDSHPNYNFGNFGAVLDFNNGLNNSFRHVQLSLGLNRLKNFNQRFTISRDGLQSSFINDRIIVDYDRDADGILDSPDLLQSFLNNDFYRAYVMDIDTTDNSLYSVYFDPNATYNQRKSIKESGYLNEFSMSLSTNYENKLYLGATIGIPFGSYTCKSSFAEERFVDGQSTGYYVYNEEQNLSVTGINLKIGAIARPVEWLRIGAAIHTPTYYNVDDDYYSDVNYGKGKFSGGWWPYMSYNMTSPWRFIGSLALVLGNNSSPLSGTISADFEHADYSYMTFDMENDVNMESSLNQYISNGYKSANIMRIGGEMKYGRMRARLGYANFGNPYQSKDNNNGSWNFVTCGVGYKGKTYSFDIGYAYGKNSDAKYYMYDVYNVEQGQYETDSNPSKLSASKHLLQATFGVRF